MIYHIAETTSTNDLAREERYGHGDVICAERQTAGRGQRGHTWTSPEGVNLLFSVVLCPTFLPAGEQFLLSQAVALALVDTLGTCGIDARIKWTNDIYAGDRKLVGILIEHHLAGGRLARTGAGLVRALGAAEDPALETERHLTTPKHYAYLKISEGCNWKCGYCAIPLIRGGHVSVPMERLEEEARKLAAGGVKELIVIAQDTTYYGLDLYGRRMLAELLRRLCRIGGIEWIRLHYAYPTAFPDEVIEVMASEPKICKYLDIPFQHISDAQLSAMQRRHTKADAYALIGRLRGAIPDLALRTTLLVGYPGETQADFAELEEFVRDVRFERLGVFAYSEEEGTYSAQKLQDNVPEEVKQQRVERIMALQNVISLENNLRRVGRTERVLIDSRQGDYYVGRTQYDSPEVDQEILIPASEKRLLRGRFYDVRIDSAADYDLYGRAAGK